MEKVSLTIIIVNYNVANEIRNCLISIEKYLSINELHIIVVDNNSPNRDIEDLEKEFSWVTFCFLGENLGFSGGNNYGFSLCNSEYVLFMNPDIILIEDCVTPLLQVLKDSSKIGLASCLLLNEDRTLQSSFGGKRGVLVEMSEAFYFIIPLYLKIKKYFIDKKINREVPFKIAWTSGAFMLTKKDYYEKTGGFDNSYPLNYEDMDLCAKYYENNLAIYIHPLFKCIHLESRSQKRNYYRFVYSRYYGRLLYISRHIGSFKRYIIIFLHIIGLIIRALIVKAIFKGEEKKQRQKAFYDSLKLYLGFDKK
ncbi:MAG: glycosyltransferase family 2 protein [Ignavibacteria bacterium]|nr:glycosyltransferase family 2 protein [Ignavibacteria bacterium]